MINTEPNQALRTSVSLSVTFEKGAATAASVLGLIIIGVGVSGPV